MTIRGILEKLANGTLSLDDEIEKNNINVLFRHCDDWEHIVICENGINISERRMDKVWMWNEISKCK